MLNRSPYHRSPYRRSPYRRSPYRRSPYRRSPYRRSPYRRSPYRRRSPYQSRWTSQLGGVINHNVQLVMVNNDCSRAVAEDMLINDVIENVECWMDDESLRETRDNIRIKLEDNGWDIDLTAEQYDQLNNVQLIMDNNHCSRAVAEDMMIDDVIRNVECWMDDESLRETRDNIRIKLEDNGWDIGRTAEQYDQLNDTIVG